VRSPKGSKRFVTQQYRRPAAMLRQVVEGIALVHLGGLLFVTASVKAGVQQAMEPELSERIPASHASRPSFGAVRAVLAKPKTKSILSHQ
jgi:hypothetical protein